MENTINTRIAAIIKIKEMNVTSFSKLIGIAQTSLRDVVTGGAEPKFSTLEKIIIAEPSINANWLITGKGEMLRQDAKEGINLSNVGTGNIANAGTIGSIHHPYSNNVVGSDLNADNCLKEEEKDQQIILLKEKVLHLEEMLQEKERLIQILLKK